MAEFYVSPTGSDSSSGRSADSAGAFQTIERAQQAMRASAGADTVHIRGGTYVLNAPLSLTAADAGSSFVAYAGERAVLSGGKAVTGWQTGPDGVWTARVSASDIRQLVVGGVAQTEARYPNYDDTDPVRGGWLWAKAPGQLNPTREMAYDTTKLSAAQVVPGGRVTVFSELGYSADVLTIASVDTAAGIIRFVGEADYEIGAKSRFYVSGGKPQLDRTGEWWFDKTSQTLSFKAPAGFNGSNAVAAGGDTTLIRVDNASNIVLKGLTFANTTTTAQTNDSSSAAVVIMSSTAVTVEGNSFTNVAKGVLIDDDSHHNTVSANSFSDIGASAIEIEPGAHENLITNNIISRVGVHFRAASAISLTESWGNTVSHNRIQDVPRFGIQETHYDRTQKSGGNIYEYNEVLRSGRETPDTGGIYTYSGEDDAHLGNIIRYNHIVDTGGVNTVAGGFVPGSDFSWGIYLDDYTSNTQVYGNFVSGTVLGGVNVHGGTNNVVYNNVLLDNAKVGLHVQEIDRAMPGNVFHHNVVQVGADRRVVAADPEFISPSAFHDNIYYNPNNLTPRLDDYTLEQWRAMGGDPGTEVVTSVGFVDAAAGNYAFTPGSFVLTQGILQLPQNLAGPIKNAVVPPIPPAIPPIPPPVVQPPAIPPIPPPVVQPPAIPPTPPPVVQPPGTPAKIVQGTSGNDVLRAQAGAERLIGGAGADTFVFTSTSTPATSDVVVDFKTGVDRLQLSRMFFDATGGSVDLKAGSMAAQGQHFIANLNGLATRSQFAQVIYETDTGTLRWDPDGASSRPSAIIATFLNAPALGAGDIFLV